MPPDHFNQVVNELIRSETALVGLVPTEWEANENTFAADGGIDGLIKVGPRAPSRMLPPGPAVLQFKRTTISEAKARKEISGHAKVKAQLASGGAYVLIIGEALGRTQRDKLTKAVKEAAKKACPSANASVLTGNELAEWCADHIGVVSHPAFAAAGVPKFYHLDDREKWATKHTLPWVGDEGRDRIVERLRNECAKPGSFSRVTGPPGAGKSRLVLRAVEGLPSIDVAYAPEFGDWVKDILRVGSNPELRRGVLVVDECSSEQHEALYAARASAAKLSVITVGASDTWAVAPANPSTLQVRPLTIESAAGLAKSLLNDNGLLSEHIAQKSGGFPKLLALLVEIAKTDPNGVQSLKAAGTDAIRHALKRLLGADQPGSAVRAVCLARRFIKPEVDPTESKSLASACGVTELQIVDAIHQLKKRSLIGSAGTAYYVTPKLLADLLAYDLWSERGTPLFSSIQAAAPRRLFFSCLRRLVDIGDVEEVRSLADQLLVENGKAQTQEGLQNADTAEFIEELSTLQPERATDVLGRILQQASQADLLKLSGSARRSVVTALRRGAWVEASFASAAALLLRLGLAETETYANNSRGVFASLFATYLGGTEAKGSLRLQVISELWDQSKDDPSKLLLLDGLETALSMESMGEAKPFPDAIRPESRWKPDYAAEKAYREGAGELLKRVLSDPSLPIAGAALHVVAKCVRTLFARGLWALAKELIEVAKPRARSNTELLSALRVIAEYDLKRLPAEAAKVHASVTEALAPTTLQERVVHLAGDIDDSGVGRARFEPLCSEVLALAASERDGTLEWLSNQDLPGVFDLAGALAAADTESKLAPILKKLASRRPPPRVVTGYVAGLSPELAEPLLDEWSLESALAYAVLDAIWLRPPSSRGARRLCDLLDAGRLQAGDLQRLLLGGWLLRVDIDSALSVISRVAKDPMTAVSLLHQLAHQNKSDSKVTDLALEMALRVDSAALRMADTHSVWQWQEILSAAAAQNSDRVGTRLVELFGERVADPERLPDEVSALLKTCLTASQPTRVALFKLLETVDPGIAALWVMSFRPLPESKEVVRDAMDWANRGDHQRVLLSQLCMAPRDDDVSIGAALLDAFPSDKRIASNLAAVEFSGSWVGQVSGFYASIHARLDSLSRSARPALAGWARKLLPRAKASMEAEVSREAEEAIDMHH
jgi:hypothetical protein